MRKATDARQPVKVTASAETLASISTPDRVDARWGPLEFVAGAPTRGTSTLVYHLDFLHGVQAFIDSFPAASTHALREGLPSIGVQDDDILIYSDLMNTQSLFLTANAETVAPRSSTRTGGQAKSVRARPGRGC